MPRARNSKASICRECKKRLLENKLWEKGHTRLRKHAEKDKKKGKGRRVGSSSGRRIERRECLPRSILPECEIVQEPIQPHFRATLGAYLARRNHTGGSGIRHGRESACGELPPGTPSSVEPVPVGRFSRDHLAAGTGRMVDRQADRVDNSFISHSLKSNKSAKPSQWQVRPRKHFEKERSG